MIWHLRLPWSILLLPTIVLALAGCVGPAADRDMEISANRYLPIENVEPSQLSRPLFAIDSNCIGNPVTQKCAIDTYWACIAWQKPILCGLVGVKYESVRELVPGEKLKSLSYRVDSLRWDGGFMGWHSGVYDTRKRWPVLQAYCDDELCAQSRTIYTFFTLAPDWPTGLWKIVARNPGYPHARYPWQSPKTIYDLSSDDACLGDMRSALCAALTVLACREQGLCRDMATGKLSLTEYAFRPDRYIEYRVVDLYEHGALGVDAARVTAVIEFRSCKVPMRAAGLCRALTSRKEMALRMRFELDGVWVVSRVDSGN